MELSWNDLKKEDIAFLAEEIRKKRVVVGFDGFIDTLVKPIKQWNRQKIPDFFRTTSEFCSFIMNRVSKSASVELFPIIEKIGGNMSNVAATLQLMGAEVTCIGSMGFPEIHPLFLDTLRSSKLYSVANPGLCTAFEFTDGKLMWAINRSVNGMDWNTILASIDCATLKSLYVKSDLAAFLNWSEIPHAEEIWSGIYELIASYINKSNWALFDLCDCSRRSEEALKSILRLIRLYSEKERVILSLNANECNAVSRVLFGEDAAGKCLKEIRESLGVEIVVCHTPGQTLADTEKETVSLKNRHVEHPVISTGSGDNFNAGFCSAVISGLGVRKSLLIASLYGSFYVAHGKPATTEALKKFMLETA